MENPLLAQQQAFGNQAVQRLLNGAPIQAKLRVGQPGDRYEQEADRVADAVVHMPEPDVSKKMTVSENDRHPRIQRMCSKCQEELHEQPAAATLSSSVDGPRVQRVCNACEEHLDEEEGLEALLQTKEIHGRTPELTPGKEPGAHSAMSGGQPLPESMRAYFEPRFVYDFSEVRIHTDNQASRSAQAMNAVAYTVGTDIVFARGEYAPATSAGKRLLAHELAHVVQQEAAGTSAIQAQVKVFEDCDCIMESMNKVNAADTAVEVATEQTEKWKADLEEAIILAGTVCAIGAFGGLAGIAGCIAAGFNVRSKTRSFELAAKAQIRAEEALADAEIKLDVCEESCAEE